MDAEACLLLLLQAGVSYTASLLGRVACVAVDLN